MTTRLRLSLLLLSAATLAFEINLTRLFSVAQFYHFAFMVVSLALLGFGASGSILAIFPTLGRRHPARSLGWLALACGLACLGAYLLTNGLPFDSFSMAVDPHQMLILVLHYLALALPFFFCGMAVSLLLEAFPQSAGGTYAVNLLGSALGCALALLAPPLLGGEGMVLLATALSALAALLSIEIQPRKTGQAAPRPAATPSTSLALASLSALALLATLLGTGLRLARPGALSMLDIRLSPYKSLSYALQYPGSQVIYRRWNSFSRVDVVRSGGIHSLPGLSYRYLEDLPPQDGLLVDGDDLSAVLPADSAEFVGHLPAAVAFLLRPQADTLVLEPRGGLDVITALALSSGRVTAVEANPLIVQASPVYADPRLQVVVLSGRSYLRQTEARYDVILLSLSSSYHPVSSGAYTLAEDYRYTVESFQDALAHLQSDGLLVATRWLQETPSESLRLFALAVTALENTGGDPQRQIVALRGYNTATLLVKNAAFTETELQSIREFAASRAFDLTYAPGIHAEETNCYNILPESVYYQAYMALIETSPRAEFYAAYPYDVRPPSDDHPFFGHYFKWSQVRQVLAGLGKTWQPFGGAGYFVILALLILAILLAAALILLPLAVRRRPRAARPAYRLQPLPYFVFIGFAFLLVEIPLMQRFILFLGQPAYAMTAVIFSLLLFSSLGSQLSRRIPPGPALGILTIWVFVTPLVLPPAFAAALGLPFGLRLVLTALLLAPTGFLMGIPFPAGLRLLSESTKGQAQPTKAPDGQSAAIPWAWAVNGAASVVASVLAALLALSLGFNWVLRIGGLCYALAGITVLVWRWRRW